MTTSATVSTMAAGSAAADGGANGSIGGRWSSPLGRALLGAVLMWLAFPPAQLWPLAWVAPCCWISLITDARLCGRRPYRMLYVVGLFHWLLMLQWIRLPHWTAHLGWLALSLYLAVYLPAFVVLSRVLVHRWCVPVWCAAPVVWTGLEWGRGHLLTGFSLSLLGHTQVPWLTIIQIADLGGAYAVSFLLMLVSAALVHACIETRAGRRWWPLVMAAGVGLLAWGYGAWRMQDPPASIAEDGSRLRVGLVQCSIDTTFREDVDESGMAFQHCLRLSRSLLQQHPQVELVIWPESMFTEHWPWLTHVSAPAPPADVEVSPDVFRENVATVAAENRRKSQFVAQQLHTRFLVGTGATHVGQGTVEQFNAALLFDRSGELQQRYDKMHPVMFGEYLPFGHWFPWLYRLTPIPSGLTPGKGAVGMPIGDWQLCASICFENTVPHLIRRQLLELERAGRPVDMLVTVTNDGWFWGSSLLDLHLACGIFRAVEHRLPLAIAANTGFSAVVDGNGRRLVQGPRRAEATLVADVQRDGRWSLYRAMGEWPAGLCLLIGLAGVCHRATQAARRCILGQ